MDSNTTSLAYAEESSLKTLPGSPVWYALEPNSYSDFGGNISTVNRSPITVGRQKRKGTITDIEAMGGFSQDVTQNNLLRLMQGFFFADAHEHVDTRPLNGNPVVITGVTTADDSYAAAAGLGGFLANSLVLASGFSVAANNGIKNVVSASATGVVVSENLSDETPTANARLEMVGIQGASGDITITASASSIVIGSTALNFTTLGLSLGEWIFIGGDTAATRFDNNAPGYARISAISANSLTLSQTTFTALTDTGVIKTIRLFFGKFIRNENTCALIKRRSYQLERQLGCQAGNVQSEYILGAIPNQFNLTMPVTDKVTAELSFVGMDVEHRTALEGIKAGTRIASPNEDAINTSSDIYRVKMSIISQSVVNSPSLFAYVSEFNISINNNVTGQKAIGVLGNFDASVGDFEVTGNVTAYFDSVDAVEAIRANSDVALNAIFAKGNMGTIYDFPLIGLSDGRINVTKDQPITIPLTTSAFENSLGYTAAITSFSYLPNVAMPVI